MLWMGFKDTREVKPVNFDDPRDEIRRETNR